MRKIFISLLLLGVSLQLSAQKDIMKEPIPVAMFQATYAFQLPAFDTKTSFGVNSTIGASFVYKTESNWIFTANGNYIFGNKVKGDRIEIYGEGITTTNGEITGGEGTYCLLNINQRGMHFQSETDTEVLVQLIEHIMVSNDLPLLGAVQVALHQVIGAYAIAILDREHADTIVCARQSSPLVVGLGADGDFFLASDASPREVLPLAQAPASLQVGSPPRPGLSGAPLLSQGLALSRGPTNIC